MTAAGPRERSGVFTIPAGLSFVDALAEGLLARAADPLDLARGTVFLPTRRACRALQEAFLRAVGTHPLGGRALLLPRLVPLGDLDAEDLLLAADEMPGLENLAADLAPPLPGLRRQLLLAELIRRWGALRGEAPPEDQEDDQGDDPSPGVGEREPAPRDTLPLS